jgi:hypothetical protein
LVTNPLACLGDKEEKKMNWKDDFLHAAFLTLLVFLAHTLSDLIDMLVRLILHD